jgi:hypothetical protein
MSFALTVFIAAVLILDCAAYLFFVKGGPDMESLIKLPNSTLAGHPLKSCKCRTVLSEVLNSTPALCTGWRKKMLPGKRTRAQRKRSNARERRRLMLAEFDAEQYQRNSRATLRASLILPEHTPMPLHVFLLDWRFWFDLRSWYRAFKDVLTDPVVRNEIILKARGILGR